MLVLLMTLAAPSLTRSQSTPPPPKQGLDRLWEMLEETKKPSPPPTPPETISLGKYVEEALARSAELARQAEPERPRKKCAAIDSPPRAIPAESTPMEGVLEKAIHDDAWPQARREATQKQLLPRVVSPPSVTAPPTGQPQAPQARSANHANTVDHVSWKENFFALLIVSALLLILLVSLVIHLQGAVDKAEKQLKIANDLLPNYRRALDTTSTALTAVRRENQQLLRELEEEEEDTECHPGHISASCLGRWCSD